MANVYVWSGAAGTGSGADWTNAKTTLAAHGAPAGDDIWVAHDHAESTTNPTITFVGTAASPNRVICVNRAGSVPPVAADIRNTATVTTTGATAINLRGVIYMEGITFNCGTGGTSASLSVADAAGDFIKAKNCAFNLVTTATGSRLVMSGISSGFAELDDCTVSFGATGQGLNVAGGFVWRNKPGSVAITGATIPNNLVMTANAARLDSVLFSGLDLSALSGKTLVGVNHGTRFDIVNCKLPSSITMLTTPTNNNAEGVRVIGSHSSGNVERNEIHDYFGSLTTETTIIRTAGATDGTTAYSWKIATSANTKRTFPFETFEGVVWNADTGSSKTLTVHVVTDNVTLTDAEIWLEDEYLGSSATPVTSKVDDASATVLTAGANQTSDSSEAWTTTGLTTPVKQKLEVSFTPQMVGAIRWKVKVAKASTTVYVCPKAELS